MSAGHALFSPSAAHRWMNCPGAVAFCRDIPEEPSEFAEEGTRAHAVAAQAVVNVLATVSNAVKPLAELTDDADMIEAAAAYANFLLRMHAETPFRIWKVENVIDLAAILLQEGACGTADFWAATDTGVLVADFKYGRKPVPVGENPQLMLYAAGLLQRFTQAEDVTLVIYQPHCGGGAVWKTTRRKVFEFARLAASKANQAEAILRRVEAGGLDIRTCGALIPGPKQCAYCRGAATCPALAQSVVETTAVVKAEQAAETPAALPVPAEPEQLARALPWLDLIESWCDKVRSAARARIEAGGTVPGYKLVEGRAGPRKWTDDAEEKLARMSINKGVLYVSKLISPAQAEKAAKAGQIGPRQWKEIQTFITRSDPKPMLVPDSDPREALTFESVEDDFYPEEGDIF